MGPWGARLWACAAMISTMVLAACDEAADPPVNVPRPAAPDAFAFAAAGDHGANDLTDLGLEALDRSNAEFYLALGDLDYDEISSDQAWCEYVTERLPSKGPRFPFELVAGNHEDHDEDDGADDGRIADFAKCLPDRLGARAGPERGYGVEYAFDYPARRPLARFVAISPGLELDGEEYTYEPGSPHREWLVEEIDGARESGIRWVVVAAHQPCLNTGLRHGCDSGEEVMNLLLAKRVDLFLAGHNHLYERSKQLALDESHCPRVVADSFDAGCVVDAGADGSYVAGRGTVMVTAGSFGRLEPDEDDEDAERRYFAVTDAETTGFVEYTVSRDRLAGTLVRTGGPLDDSFEIRAQ